MPDDDTRGVIQGPQADKPATVGAENRAHIISTFAEPLLSKPADTNFMSELGKALSIMEPSLQSLNTTEFTKYTDDQVAEGQKAAIANRDAFKSAIDAGQLPPGASPWFQKGYQQQQMRLAAQNYEVALHQAWQQSGVKNSDNPDDLTNFTKGFTSRWVGDKGLMGSPEFNSSFVPIMNQAQQNLANAHTAYRQQQIESSMLQGTDQEVSNILDTAQRTGFTDQASVSVAINNLVQHQYASGMSGTVLNHVVSSNLIRQARETGDTSYLDMLDRIKAGTGTLGGISAIRQEADAARQEINLSVLTRMESQARLEKAERAKAADQLTSGALGKLFDDPTADVSKDIKSLNAIDPTAAMSLYRDSRTIADNAANKVEDNPSEYYRLTGIALGGRPDARDQIIAAMAAKTISAKTGLGLLKDRAEYDAKHANDGDGILEDPMLRRSLGELRTLYTNGSDKFDKAGDAVEYENAVGTLQKWALAHEKQNPNEDPVSRAKWVMSAQALLMQHGRPWADNATGAKTFTDIQAPGAAPEPAPEPAPAPAPQQGNSRADAANAAWQQYHTQHTGPIADYIASHPGSDPTAAYKAIYTGN